MKIVRTHELENTERDVEFTGGHSIRLVIQKDEMGFGICKTHIPKGGPHHWHYPNHLEACYCIKGHGYLTNIETGEKFLISPDLTYLLNKNDDHTFEALTDVVLISVFNPPLKGNEKHDENGQYTI
jgi:L-ectoine synthase